MVMPKRLKELERLKELAGKATENQLARMIDESANQIWLAGLGAFSKAQQEGGRKFEALVAEGEKLNERTKVAADERLAELREKATGTWDELEKVSRTGWRECCTP
jgi:poly(hydroxyalkanoate) granule-associated protein